MSEEFDPDRKYNAPLYGAIGILYNSKRWTMRRFRANVLWDEAYSQRIIMQNSMRLS